MARFSSPLEIGSLVFLVSSRRDVCSLQLRTSLCMRLLRCAARRSSRLEVGSLHPEAPFELRLIRESAEFVLKFVGGSQ